MTVPQQLESPFRVFDSKEDTLVIERKLPHWAQPGTLCFITFRTCDSMPKSVLERWQKERGEWLKRHGIDFSSRHAPRDAHHAERDDYNMWRQQFERLEVKLQREFHEKFSQHWHEELDACHGECVLRQPSLAKIVATSLKHFEGERYELTDFVVMPNHVHLIAAFRDSQQMLAQCESWKHYTAMQINRSLNRKGRFWQQDGFDHLIRSIEQFEYLRRYIADNPVKANLDPSEFSHESKQLK